jgi:hypothetical protein
MRTKTPKVACSGAIEILELCRASMWSQVLQMFLGKEHLVKNWLIFTLDKVIYFKRISFGGLQNLSSFHKIGWESAKTIYPFFLLA